MPVELISHKDKQVTIQVTIQLQGSMLEAEQAILDATNELGIIATEKALSEFDTDGTPIVVGNTKLTSKRQQSRTYQSPYGQIKVARHLYQSSQGGKTYCPLEYNARIINGATPCFAKILSNKYAKMPAPEVIDDLEDNHGRHTTLRYLQQVSESVAAIAQVKEETWKYATPKIDMPIETVSISLDGAYVLMHEDGWREAMVGSVSLYDKSGERHHTIYVGVSPEYGKAEFKRRIAREILHIKSLYPKAQYLGIADGAKSNWEFLKVHTSKQLIDFYHVTEYLAKVAEAVCPRKTGKPERQAWLAERCHQLKHEHGSAQKILSELKTFTKKRLRKELQENLSNTITYFENNHHMMNYADHVKKKLPIGSGVTEAACKTLIKQRLCQSGMRWKRKGMKVVLSLRQLVQTGNRWTQFWEKINQFGVPVII